MGGPKIKGMGGEKNMTRKRRKERKKERESGGNTHVIARQHAVGKLQRARRHQEPHERVQQLGPLRRRRRVVRRHVAHDLVPRRRLAWEFCACSRRRRRRCCCCCCCGCGCCGRWRRRRRRGCCGGRVGGRWRGGARCRTSLLGRHLGEGRDWGGCRRGFWLSGCVCVCVCVPVGFGRREAGLG